jgi:hypothetical protein
LQVVVWLLLLLLLMFWGSLPGHLQLLSLRRLPLLRR